MKNKRITLVISFFLILISVSAFAQGPGGRGGRPGGRDQQRQKPKASDILKMLDTNDDEKIDKEEASKDRRGKIAEDFDEIDANADGFIDLEELETSLEGKPRKISAEKIIKEVDQNEDGFLNELEVAAKDKRDLLLNFSKIDTNEDAQIDLEELKVFYLNNESKGRKRRKSKN